MNPQSAYSGTWPYRCNRSIIHLMVQTPYTLFAYWKVNERFIRLITELYAKEWTDFSKQIRLLQYDALEDVSTPISFKDIIIHDRESCYIHHVHPNACYRVDYGYLNPDGQFVALIRSNLVPASHVPHKPFSSDLNSKDIVTLPIVSDSLSPSSSIEHSQALSPFEQFSTYSWYTNTPLQH